MRRMRLLRESLTDLTADDLARVAGAATTDLPSCVLLACAVSGEGCQTVLKPCYESTQCSHPC